MSAAGDAPGKPRGRERLPIALLSVLYDLGLGDLPVLFSNQGKLMLGHLHREQDALVLRDAGLVRHMTPSDVEPCWDLGVIGAVCGLRDREWRALSFVGANRCRIPVDLSRTRHDLLRRVSNADGEQLVDFVGSVYRGYKIMLDGHLLPVVLPLAIETTEGAAGLAVCDFRFAAAPLDTMIKINDLVRAAIDRHLTLKLEDIELPDEEFNRLFGGFVGAPKAD